MSRNRHLGRAGVTLIEVIVALGILALVLVALGGLMYSVSYQTRRSAALAYRAGATQTAEAWANGLPWDSVPKAVPNGAVGCTSGTNGQLAYSRCGTVADVTSTLRRIILVISSTGNLVALPETLVVDRTKPANVSPFSP